MHKLAQSGPRMRFFNNRLIGVTRPHRRIASTRAISHRVQAVCNRRFFRLMSTTPASARFRTNAQGAPGEVARYVADAYAYSSRADWSLSVRRTRKSLRRPRLTTSATAWQCPARVAMMPRALCW